MLQPPKCERAEIAKVEVWLGDRLIDEFDVYDTTAEQVEALVDGVFGAGDLWHKKEGGYIWKCKP